MYNEYFPSSHEFSTTIEISNSPSFLYSDHHAVFEEDDMFMNFSVNGPSEKFLLPIIIIIYPIKNEPIT